ncbi:MAG: alpha/beta fold hydrolase [Bacteroidota bacterium]|nr:alpha/beta fold hydrolase [Bacteroidota bacterium]
MEVVPLFSKIYGEGRPLIILHGLFGMGDNWTTQAKIIASSGWQVHAVDQRNHGRSPHHKQHNYDALAADIELYIEDRKLENVVLLGHSMGGKTVMNFAVGHPNLVNALIVVDIAPKAYPIHHDAYIGAMKSVDFNTAKSRKDVEAKLSMTLSSADIIHFFMKSLYWKTKEELSWRFNLLGLESELPHIGDALEFGYYDGPTLFVAGGQSCYIEEQDKADIHEHFPNAVVKTIDRAGHWVHAEAREEFASCIAEFLATL